MKYINKILLALCIALVLITYRYIADHFHLPTVLAEQWYILVCCLYIVGTLPAAGFMFYNFVCIKHKSDNEIKEYRSRIYNDLQHKVISVLYPVIFFITSAGYFQVGKYDISLITFVYAVVLYSARALHKDIVSEVEIEVLKN